VSLHYFLIAMTIYGAAALAGLLLMLKDGDRMTGASLISSAWALGLCVWAVVLLAQGH
jgi:hypothetical protein